MFDISIKTYKSNDIETIVDRDGILWLNEKYIKERLVHTNSEKWTQRQKYWLRNKNTKSYRTKTWL